MKYKKTIFSLVVIALIALVSHRVLSHTYEVNIHQMRGATENQVFISKDGHKEAVYNGKGVLVTDPVNMGCYNYCSPVEESICHFFKDILPWIVLGNSLDDPTSAGVKIIGLQERFI